ncbi:hypothetical protein LguiA_034566 [Lonicera macranthoides]
MLLKNVRHTTHCRSPNRSMKLRSSRQSSESGCRLYVMGIVDNTYLEQGRAGAGLCVGPHISYIPTAPPTTSFFN